MKLAMRAILYVNLILFFLFLAACGGNVEPPYFGAFIIDGRELIEIPQATAFGIPDYRDLDGVPVAPNDNPEILLWQQNTRLDSDSQFGNGVDNKEESRHYWRVW